MRPAKWTSFFIMLVFAAGIALTARHVQAQPLYGATSQFGVCPSNLYSIDPATGAATLIGPTVGSGSSSTPYCLVSAMAFDRSNGVLYAIGTKSQGGASGFLIAIDTKTASVAEIGLADIFGTDMSFRSDGTLYVHGGSEADPVAHNIFTVDTATAAATFLGITGFLSPGNGLAFSPGDTLYHASGNSLNTIDQTTGAATHVATLSFPAACSSGTRRINAMDFRPGTGTLYGILNCDNTAWHLVTVNTGTGTVTDVGPTGVDQMDALAFQPDGFSPAQLWVGLKNSDDVGLRLDLKAEVFLNSTSNPPVASGEVDNVKSGSSGFNNAVLNSVFLTLAGGPTGISPGDELLLRVSVRRTCSGAGHASGTARLWYNGRAIDNGPARDAGSRFDVTQGGVNGTEYLRTGFELSASAGSSRTFIDKFVDNKTACPSRPFVPFGTWSTGP